MPRNLCRYCGDHLVRTQGGVCLLCHERRDLSHDERRRLAHHHERKALSLAQHARENPRQAPLAKSLMVMHDRLARAIRPPVKRARR